MSNVQILVAEDNQVNAYVISIILEKGGFTHVIASDGVEAVALAEECRPKVALLDINMPRMNGIEAAKRIQESLGEDCPVIVAVTASDTPRQREDCMAAGFDHFVAKPIRPENMIQLLRRLIHLRLIDCSEDALVAMAN